MGFRKSNRLLRSSVTASLSASAWFIFAGSWSDHRKLQSLRNLYYWQSPERWNVALFSRCSATSTVHKMSSALRYDTIRYDSVYLTCSKKLTVSQLISPPHGTNKKLKCETKNKTMSMIGPVQSRRHEGSPVGKRSLRWEGFVER